jgi:rhodanese-related sulfurtransferase
VKQVNAVQLQQLLQEYPGTVLIDVREEDEHEQFNIGGFLIPLGEIIQKADQVPTNGTVIIYCKRGIRSAIAIQKLEAKFGYTNLVNLQGGVLEWRKTILSP